MRGGLRDLFPVVVHALLIRDQKIFLLRRNKTGIMDGFYGLPGGHQNSGETVEQAMKREFLEETGGVIQSLLPICVLPYRFKESQGVNFVFEVTEWQGQLGVGEPDLFSDFVWAETDRLPERLVPWIKDILELRAAGTWFSELT